MDFERERDIGATLAHRAGAVLLSHFRSRRFESRQKGARDIVTTADIASEAVLMRGLTEAFPDDSVEAEEGGRVAANPSRVWYVDPLDGTVNYARGIPQWCVTIALFGDGVPLVGIIYDPIHGETLTAVSGRGAWRDGTPVPRRADVPLEDACVYLTIDVDDEGRHVGVDDVAALAPHVSRTRSLGSVALGLAYTAVGRLDAVVHRSAHTWDYGAGVLLVREAGGVVTDLSGEPYMAGTVALIAAATPALHADLVALLR